MRVRTVISFFLATVVPVAWVSLVACASVDEAGVDVRLRTARSVWIGWTGRSLTVAWPPKDHPSFQPNVHLKNCPNSRPLLVRFLLRQRSCCCSCGVKAVLEQLFLSRQLVVGPGSKGISLTTMPQGQFLMIGVWPICACSFVFALPLLHLCYGKTRVRIRISNNQCASCGYCLFGNESGICPECGSGVVPAGA